MLETLQVAHSAWQSREYPGQPQKVHALGVLEETAELLYAVTKLEQRELHGRDGRYSGEELRRKAADAIGDCSIYLCSYCTAHSMDFCTVLRHGDPVGSRGDKLYLAVTLVEYAKSLVDGDRIAVVRIACGLRAIAAELGQPYEHLVQSTWEDVVARGARW